jgi:NADP-dependent 3-hydroxy acid dehydrogenase YdfG
VRQREWQSRPSCLEGEGCRRETRRCRENEKQGYLSGTELASDNRPAVLESIKSQFGQTMPAEDIADAIIYIVTRPRHVAINEILIRPTEQER